MPPTMFFLGRQRRKGPRMPVGNPSSRLESLSRASRTQFGTSSGDGVFTPMPIYERQSRHAFWSIC